MTALSTAAWGWHIETAIHVLRLILSGAFDRYPGLQLIIGHLGETLPFMLPRLDLGLPVQVTKLDRPWEPICARTSTTRSVASTSLPAFLDLLFQVGVDRIMFSADYPYSSMSRPRIPGATPGKPCRQREGRTRQRRAAPATVTSV